MSKLSTSSPEKDKPRQITFMFYTSIVLFVISFLLLAAAVRSEYAANPRPTNQAVYKTGSQVVSGKASLQIDSVSYSQGSSHFTAPDGKRYLILDISIKNISNEPINVLPASDTYVKDSAGNVMLLTPVGLTSPFRAGELLPGDTIKGQLSYLVPSSSPVKFYIDAIWSGSLIAIAVN